MKFLQIQHRPKLFLWMQHREVSPTKIPMKSDHADLCSLFFNLYISSLWHEFLNNTVTFSVIVASSFSTFSTTFSRNGLDSTNSSCLTSYVAVSIFKMTSFAIGEGGTRVRRANVSAGVEWRHSAIIAKRRASRALEDMAREIFPSAISVLTLHEYAILTPYTHQTSEDKQSKPSTKANYELTQEEDNPQYRTESSFHELPTTLFSNWPPKSLGKSQAWNHFTSSWTYAEPNCKWGLTLILLVVPYFLLCPQHRRKKLEKVDSFSL